MNPSLFINASLEVIVILPPASVDQVMEGSGTPLAVQLNVTIPVSFPITSTSSDGSVISTGATDRVIIRTSKRSEGVTREKFIGERREPHTCHVN